MRTQKKLFSIIFGAILIAIFLSADPLLVFATHDGDRGHLISCATHYNATGQKIPGMLSPLANNSLCSICDLLVLLQTGFNFIWKFLTIPIATVMLLYGGFLMVLPSFTGNTNQISNGRGILLHTVMGLAIVFFAWIGVDSILKIMGGQQTGNFGPWNKIVCDEEAAKIKFIGGPVDVIPPAYQCGGATTKKVDGLDVCDPGVQLAMVTRWSIIGSGSGQCKAEKIKTLNDKYGTMLDRVAADEGVDPKLLRAVALIESSGNPSAVSPQTRYGQACGLVQVLPSTAGVSCESLKNPETGARAGAKYIKILQDSPQVQRLGGARKYVLMKYNATAQALEQSNDCKPPAYPPGMVKGECPINPGGFTETINYVAKVESCLGSL